MKHCDLNKIVCCLLTANKHARGRVGLTLLAAVSTGLSRGELALDPVDKLNVDVNARNPRGFLQQQGLLLRRENAAACVVLAQLASATGAADRGELSQLPAFTPDTAVRNGIGVASCLAAEVGTDASTGFLDHVVMQAQVVLQVAQKLVPVFRGTA